MDDLVHELETALLSLQTGSLLVVTGAGVSAASGISTFRGTERDAIWRQSDLSLATCETFRRNPVEQWQWYLQRFEAVATAQPNPSHEAFVRIEAWHTRRGGTFRLVTQNIDTLHEQAGSLDLIKVHGTADRVRCSRPGCELGAPAGSIPLHEVDFRDFRAAPSHETLPTCPVCSSVVRAHVLFFDEFYTEHLDYRFAEAEEAAETGDLILFAGTSFSVGITDLALRAGAMRQVQMFSIDPAQRPSTPWPGLIQLQAPAEELLPAVCRRLESASAVVETESP
jgi:NAD-dependent deacetylase